MTSKGAKGGFQNERDVINSFNEMSSEAIIWLHHMGFDPNQISKVEAAKAPARVKPDVYVKIFDRNGQCTATEKISVKLASSAVGFNQIDRGRVIDRYSKLWKSLSSDAATGLRLFTGDLPPLQGAANNKRMFLQELPGENMRAIIEFFTANKLEVLSDLLAGREPDKAGWFLAVNRSNNSSTLRPMSAAIEFYSQGPVTLTVRGSLAIGRITAQRKGGDKGAPSANDLQFKFNPNSII